MMSLPTRPTCIPSTPLPTEGTGARLVHAPSADVAGANPKSKRAGTSATGMKRKTDLRRCIVDLLSPATHRAWTRAASGIPPLEEDHSTTGTEVVSAPRVIPSHAPGGGGPSP